MSRAVFLDRDGVLNDLVVRRGRAYSPWTLEELRIVDGAASACADLREAGFQLILVTNQPDVSRGKTSRGVVEAINRTIDTHVGLDDVRVCYHDDADRCACRKPEPGLILAAAEDHGVDTSRSFMVGDRDKDIEAGRRAGCRTVLIAPPGTVRNDAKRPDFVARSFGEAADWIISRSREGGDQGAMT